MIMKIHILNEEKIKKAGILDYKQAVKDVEEAYSAHSLKKTKSSKIALDIDEKLDWKFNSLVCIGKKYSINKWLGANVNNINKKIPRSNILITLNDSETGLPLCIMNGTLISAVRTGVSAAVAAKHLAKSNATIATVIGTGPIGRETVKALASVGFNKIRISSLDDNLNEIAKQLSIDSGAIVTPSKNAEEACTNSEVIVTATTSPKPIVKNEWLNKGVLRISLGGREDYDEVILNSNKLINDDWEAVKHRNVQTISNMYHEGKISDSMIHPNIGEIILGKSKGRENDNEIIFFNAVGMGELDLFIAQRIYENSEKENSINL